MTVTRPTPRVTNPEIRISTASEQLPAYTPIDETSRSPSVDAPPPAAFPSAADEKAALDRASTADTNPYADPSPFADPEKHAQPPTPHLARSVTPGSPSMIIPTHSRSPASGYPFPPTLAAHNIAPDEWALFTLALTSAAKLSPKDWALTATSAGATLLVSGALIGWLGLVPAFFVGKGVRHGLERKQMRVGMRQGGSVEEVVRRWNEVYFRERGVVVGVELPGDASSAPAGEEAEVFFGRKRGGCCGGKGAERRMEWVEKKMERHGKGEEWRQKKMEKMEKCKGKREEKGRKMAGKRVRIVVVPLADVERVQQVRGREATWAADADAALAEAEREEEVVAAAVAAEKEMAHEKEVDEKKGVYRVAVV